MWGSVNDHPTNKFEDVRPRPEHPVGLPPRGLQVPHRLVPRVATHPFQSTQAAGWSSTVRWESTRQSGDNIGAPDCPDRTDCVRQVLAIGTPVLWWGGVFCLIIGLGYWLTRRDWRFGIPIVGVLTTWLPWFRYDDRQIFFYYGVSIIPFTVIAVTLMFGKVLGREDDDPYDAPSEPPSADSSSSASRSTSRTSTRSSPTTCSRTQRGTTGCGSPTGFSPLDLERVQVVGHGQLRRRHLRDERGRRPTRRADNGHEPARRPPTRCSRRARRARRRCTRT